MNIKHFYDPETSSLSYVVTDPQTLDAVLIDPLLDFDPASGKLQNRSLSEIMNYLKEQNLQLKGVLETHVHADHISAAGFLKNKYPDIQIGIGEGIRIVQKEFKDRFNLEGQNVNGKPYDILFKNEEEYRFGSIKVKTIATPGHTPACMSFLIDNALFTGDALFMPDGGTGRCDFPHGSATQLYQSIRKLYQLPDNTRFFTGHDYCPNGRQLRFESTIGESKKNNIHIKANTSQEDYVQFRTARDKTLSHPKLLFPSIQLNINAGLLPPPEKNDQRYLKIPLTATFN